MDEGFSKLEVDEPETSPNARLITTRIRILSAARVADNAIPKRKLSHIGPKRLVLGGTLVGCIGSLAPSAVNISSANVEASNQVFAPSSLESVTRL